MTKNFLDKVDEEFDSGFCVTEQDLIKQFLHQKIKEAVELILEKKLKQNETNLDIQQILGYNICVQMMKDKALKHFGIK